MLNVSDPVRNDPLRADVLRLPGWAWPAWWVHNLHTHGIVPGFSSHTAFPVGLITVNPQSNMVLISGNADDFAHFLTVTFFLFLPHYGPQPVSLVVALWSALKVINPTDEVEGWLHHPIHSLPNFILIGVVRRGKTWRQSLFFVLLRWQVLSKEIPR